jgi:hypothetical protein
VSALVLLHPAMSGRDAHEWCERHAAELLVEHRQGKIHLIVVAQPRACTPKTPVPASLVCEACGWAGYELIASPHGYLPVCPRCDVPFHTLSRSP